MEEPVRIELTNDEALVLFELLHRLGESSDAEFADQAEQRALWNAIAAFEKQLEAVIDPQYRELLAHARDRLRDPDS